MLKARNVILSKVLYIMKPMKKCARSFIISNVLKEKLYAPPMIIKKQDKHLKSITNNDNSYLTYPRVPILMEEQHSCSLSSYLRNEASGHKNTTQHIFQKLMPILFKESYYPRLNLDEDGYLMEPIPGPFKNSNNIVIIGGGLVGHSIAHHINRLFQGDIEVIIIENSYKFPQLATNYPMGNIRQQFGLEEFMNLSTYGIQFLEKAKDELSFEAYIPEININYAGNLFLADEHTSTEDVFHRIHTMQNVLSTDNTRILTNASIKDMFPWMEVHDIDGAKFGLGQEGWFDNYKLIEALQLNCEYYGNTFLEGEITDCVTDVEVDENSQSLLLSRISGLTIKLADGERKEVDCGTVVLAAGSSSPEIGKIFNVGSSNDVSSIFSAKLPIEKSPSYVTQFTALNGPGVNCPIVKDSSGIDFRRDGLDDSYICGWQVDENANPLTNCVEIDKYFLDVILPKLTNRVKAFKNAKVGDTIDATYDYNKYDQQPIIGFHPGVSNLFVACGFNQYGFHALGAGNYLTEMLLSKTPKINLNRFNVKRLMKNNNVEVKCPYD